jgi:hypothetical protein
VALCRRPSQHRLDLDAPKDLAGADDNIVTITKTGEGWGNSGERMGQPA